LPAEPFDLSQWSRARVNIDYHIAFDTNFYSVPYNLVHELVEVRSTPTTVEIFHKGSAWLRICAAAARASRHQPSIAQESSGASGVDALADGALGRRAIGPHTARLFERILNDKPHPEMGYRGCLGIIRLAESTRPARMEAAAERALLTGACRYQSVKSILKNSLDQCRSGTTDRLPARRRTTTSAARSTSTRRSTCWNNR
jgi:hypothetical protein